MTLTIRPAVASDLDAVRALLEQHNLPLEGIPGTLTGFFVAEEEGMLRGTAGLEPYGSFALLRSVAAASPGLGVGTALVQHVLREADAHGIEAVYLLTTTAERYFPRFGFEAAQRSDVPAPLEASVEFRGACPASAAVLVRKRRGAAALVQGEA